MIKVIINFVSNSLKFTPKGGTVHLHIRQLELSKTHSTSGFSSVASTQNRPSPSSPEVGPLEVLNAPARHSIDAKSTSQGDTLGNALIKLNSRRPHIWFEFEVQDTGPGIEKSMQQKIFEPFVQVDSRLSKNFGGTGLGLSICKQLGKLLGGDLRIESEVGKGSSFFLKVPLGLIASDGASSTSSTSKQSLHEGKTEPDILTKHTQDTSRRNSGKAPAGASESVRPRLVGLSQPYLATGTPPLASPEIDLERSMSASLRRPSRVLIAEDNQVNQEVILRMLRLENVVDVSVANNGKEAYEELKKSLDEENQYDFVFMDVQMPVMDGRESTKLIREAGFCNPIVALTAFTDEVNEKECYEG